MAIDPRISMAINPLDIHGAVRNALTNVATVQNMQRQSEQDEVLRQEQQLLNQMLSGIGGQGVAATQPHMVVPEGSTTISPGVSGGMGQPNPQAMAQLAIRFPEKFEQINKNLGLISSQQKSEAADFAFNLQNTPFEQRQAKIQQRINNLSAQGRDASGTAQLLNMDEARQNESLSAVQVAALDPKDRIEMAQGKKDFALKSFAPITDPATGQMSIPTFNPNTGQTELVPLEGARGQTAAEKRAGEISTAERLADIQVGTEARKQKVKRTSDRTKELSDRNVQSNRASIKLTKALKLAGDATQGLTGQAKLQIAKLVPGVDVSSEAALSQSLQQLALDQLQNFKGPTTDFEFGVTQQIAGKIGDPRSANIARIKSLQRDEWFKKEEFKQFKNHTRAGGDPDDFAFNIAAPIKTKKGVFTLQDVQDTAVANNLTIEETIRELNKGSK